MTLNGQFSSVCLGMMIYTISKEYLIVRYKFKDEKNSVYDQLLHNEKYKTIINVFSRIEVKNQVTYVVGKHNFVAKMQFHL